jgi:hypothetical protein
MYFVKMEIKILTTTSSELHVRMIYGILGLNLGLALSPIFSVYKKVMSLQLG